MIVVLNGHWAVILPCRVYLTMSGHIFGSAESRDTDLCIKGL